MPSSRPNPDYKRCHRFNTPGHNHLLTFCCFHRQPFLIKDRSRQWLADSILRARDLHHFKLIAYVFMPEHVHLLIRPMERRYDISAILSSIKIPVARRARAFVLQNVPSFLPRMTDRQPNGQTAIRFWQRGGGHDRNIFSPDELWEKIRYIHQNPVRKNSSPAP